MNHSRAAEDKTSAVTRPLYSTTEVYVVECRRCCHRLELATEGEANRLAQQHNAIFVSAHVCEIHWLVKAKLRDEYDRKQGGHF